MDTKLASTPADPNVRLVTHAVTIPVWGVVCSVRPAGLWLWNHILTRFHFPQLSFFLQRFTSRLSPLRSWLRTLQKVTLIENHIPSSWYTFVVQSIPCGMPTNQSFSALPSKLPSVEHVHNNYKQHGCSKLCLCRSP